MLNETQKNFYQNTLAVTKQEIDDLDLQIEAELAKVKESLAELQNAKKAARQMYDAACSRLGVANELNNILAVILGTGSLMQEHMPQTDPFYEDVQGLVVAANRGRALVRNLLGFAQHGSTCAVIPL